MAIEALTIDINGHALVLSADRAAFDPRLNTLFIADAHFGKDAVFRARGIPVPVGTTGESLARLDALVAAHRPESIVFLGDLLHARESHADETLDALAAWRARHRALRTRAGRRQSRQTRGRAARHVRRRCREGAARARAVGALSSSADGRWRLRARRTRTPGLPARDAHRQRAPAVLSLRRARRACCPRSARSRAASR